MDPIESGAPAAPADAGTPGSASPAESNAGTTPAVPAAPAANGEKSGENQHVPYDRFKEVNEEKKHFKNQYEESIRAKEALEQELSRYRQPKEEKPDPFADPEGFNKMIVNEAIAPVKRELANVMKAKVADLITEKYKGDPVLQKVFKTTDDLFRDIAKTAADAGAKELTPEVLSAAYDRTIASRTGDIARAAREMGVEEERAKSRIIDDNILPAGGEAPKALKGKPTEYDKKILGKFGWDEKKIAEKLANAEIDPSTGKRILKR